MKHAKVVIGAGYGDEGKGLATDWLTANSNKKHLVVRFNGGAQAGHTVDCGNGRRHIFSHIGSGSLNGAATYLSRFFVCHPMMFETERQALLAAGCRPRVYVDGAALVTTPFDVMLNQALEAARGNQRHGSCGLGFGETIERDENSPFTVRVADLHDVDTLRRRLLQIRDHYVPHRLKTLGVGAPPELANSAAIVERFIVDTRRFLQHVEVPELAPLAATHEIIFEGAQGLMLDMDYGEFPHVTRSNTGLVNVANLARAANIDSLEVLYATRAYVSRHGAGPLANELPEKPAPTIKDATNVANAWQGALRFAWLDIDILGAAIRADLAHGKDLVRSTTLLVSCLDQLGKDISFHESGELRVGSREDLAQALTSATACDRLFGSFGPTREDIRMLDLSDALTQAAAFG